MGKLREPGWTAGRARVVPSEMASPSRSLASASGSLRFGSSQDTNYFESRGRRGYPDSGYLESNHVLRPACPAVYPILQPGAWSPDVCRLAHPVELPGDNLIVPLALAYLTYLLFRYCAKRIAWERFVPDLAPAGVLRHREDLFDTGRMKRLSDKRHLCGARHHETRQSSRCCTSWWN